MAPAIRATSDDLDFARRASADGWIGRRRAALVVFAVRRSAMIGRFSIGASIRCPCCVGIARFLEMLEFRTEKRFAPY
jgi:hypothetical protein